MQEARKIVTTIDPNDLTFVELVGDCWGYYKDQERRVAERGGCEACGPAELKDCSGRIVCRRTLNVCPRLQLAEIVSLYESAFNECNS